MGLLDAFKNTNIFGARKPTYLEGIATPEQIKQAEQQSLVQGLLGTAVGYLAQPKNQGYGSAIPYLAKGYLQGMQSAQAPYQGLERDVLMKSKFQDIQREQDIAKQKRQMTEQLLNDPRVKGNPLYESMAINAPADLFKELEKVTVIREGGKAIKGSTGQVIAESPKAPKAPEDKRSEFQRIVDAYNTMDDSDPRKKMYGDYITQKTTSSSKAKKDEVKPSTKSDYEATAIYLGSTQYGEIASEIAPIVTDRAKEIQKTQGIDYIDARNQALMELVQSGAITEGNLYGYNFNPSALSKDSGTKTKPVPVTSKEDIENLPVGTVYITPNGTINTRR